MIDILILIAFIVYFVVDWWSYRKMKLLLDASMAMNLWTYYFLAEKYEDYTPKK